MQPDDNVFETVLKNGKTVEEVLRDMPEGKHKNQFAEYLHHFDHFDKITFEEFTKNQYGDDTLVFKFHAPDFYYPSEVKTFFFSNIHDWKIDEYGDWWGVTDEEYTHRFAVYLQRDWKCIIAEVSALK